jgi:hypothetical protein
MVTSYILILVFSAWLGAFALCKLGSRLGTLLGVDTSTKTSVIAALVAIAFLMVASAPGWVLVLAIILFAVPHARLTQALPESLPSILLLLIVLALCFTPWLGAPSWIALDSALIASSILGATQARGIQPIGRAFLPYAWLILWLAFEAARHLSTGASYAS